MQTRRKWMWLGLSAIVLLTAGLFWRMLDHDLDRHATKNFTFHFQDIQISGTIWHPTGDPIAVAALVHGDGPQDRTSAGGYAPLINTLLDAQIAVASWDKPGIGGSEGNWLDQSMADRAGIAARALSHLRNQFGDDTVGAIGFSQAGWVLPRLSKDDADFLVLVGPAVSWKDQGAYYTHTRLTLEGLSEAEIDATLQSITAQNDITFGENAAAVDAPPDMSADRWAFIKRNRRADARDHLGTIDMPLLAIWGADDLNVDAAADIETYLSFLPGFPAGSELLYVPDATQGLLKSAHYNWQLTEQWHWHAKLWFFLEGRHAFAPRTLGEITDWIRQLSVP